MDKRILIAGGGTGGHVYPALAIIDSLRQTSDVEFLYVGGKNGIETRIVPGYGIRMKTIWIAGVLRKLTLKNLLFPLKMVVSLVQSWNIIRSFRPHAAVGTGGYVTGPILFTASKMGVPVLILEPDAYAGLTTRWLSKHVSRICLAFKSAGSGMPAAAEKMVVTGNPVRSSVRQGDLSAARLRWKLSADKLTLFIFGGSQGARSINLAIAGMIGELLEKHPLQLIWQTGRLDYDTMKSNKDLEHPDIHLMAYIDDMADAYAAADIIVSRAGSGTLAELALIGKAAILIPYPFATADHQRRNSEAVEKEGAAFLISEENDWQDRLRATLVQLLEDSKLRETTGHAWAAFACPDAADSISREVLALMETR